MKRKLGHFYFLIILIMTIGPFFLIRSCLSKYDEYSIESNTLLFKSTPTDVIVYIKDYFKVTSRIQEGGITSIGGNHRYYLETRDVSTLQLLKSTPIKVSDNQFPSVIGNSAKILWIFNEQLFGYDPFTHHVICDEKKLAQLNPELLNNFPKESRYYTYDYRNDQLQIFTRNAKHYLLNVNYKTTINEEDNYHETNAVSQLKTLLNIYKGRQKNEKRFPSYFLWQDSIEHTKRRMEVLEEEYQNQKDFQTRYNEFHRESIGSLNNLTINTLIQDSFVYALTTRKEINNTKHNLYVNQNISSEELKYLSKAKVQ